MSESVSKTVSEITECRASFALKKQAGAELCQAQFKLRSGGQACSSGKKANLRPSLVELGLNLAIVGGKHYLASTLASLGP